MNNPFYYTPSAECLKAVKEVADWLRGKPSPFCDHPVDPAFRAEIDKGKMFGVLCLAPSQPQEGRARYLAAYSGQVCGRSDWQEFVPAVFDYLQPDGYFKLHEDEIVNINKEIAAVADVESQEGKTHAEPRPDSDKTHRQEETDEEYIRRRQFENAELHRWKIRQRKLDEARLQNEQKLRSLKTLRRQKSDDLQRWLFRHFKMRNGKGETQDLLQITQWYRRSATPALPPAGSGECCEPKLLQYAFTHGLQPASMAMFWWGESPKGEVRHHLHFYPACNSKCKPILSWMLQGIDVDENPLESRERDSELAARLKIIYEDSGVCVISKPAGLLSVPGKTNRESVLGIMRRRYPDTDSPLIVHRLDMATSGLMVIAKSMAAYHDLQQQFARHEIKKKYVAVLENKVSEKSAPPDCRKLLPDSGDKTMTGCISLPLCPDIDDRPRQMVDFKYGKTAVTYYQFASDRIVYLWPQTGRTHQLRVHCAHKLGLNNPIMGDELYGTRADRLYLHAEEIRFKNPTTGKDMKFTDKADWQLADITD